VHCAVVWPGAAQQTTLHCAVVWPVGAAQQTTARLMQHSADRRNAGLGKASQLWGAFRHGLKMPGVRDGQLLLGGQVLWGLCPSRGSEDSPLRRCTAVRRWVAFKCL
jgi:hypothetical protein